MADEPAGTELTEAEVESFVKKLEKWGESLSVGEKGMLNLLLARAEAGAEADDVGGFAFLTVEQPRPLPSVRANDLLQPLIRPGGLFFDVAAGGTYSSWGRG